MKKVIFKEALEIKKKFIEDGWNETISFSELSLEQAKKIGCFTIVEAIMKGRKYFKMVGNGNIYDQAGNIALFNIPTKC